MKLPEEIPKWPQFNKETNQFLEINSNKIKVITTPNKERLERIREHLYADRELQYWLAKSESKLNNVYQENLSAHKFK